MKSMKGLSMNKMLGSIKKKAGGNSSEPPPTSAATAAENPEVTAHNSVKAFCESGGNVKSDEVLFLPPIVDAAESSPAAAAECARIIRKFMSKEYSSRPSWQYNAIMLVRILTDNPGQTFTRNMDDKFVDTTRSLLKNSKDRNVRQILMETLDDFEHTKMYDENLGPIVQMWKKEKEKALKDYGGRMPPTGPRPPVMSPPAQFNRHSQNYFAKAHSNNRLPDPIELASRLEEARTSAKLLEQVVMNTPPDEMLHNELIREFANRCLSASRSIQGYMVSENPSPDNDTMEGLIDTNEQLQTALNQHQRAVLSAKKQLGLGTGSNDESPAPETNGSDREPDWPTSSAIPVAAAAGIFAVGGNGKGKQAEVYSAPDGPPPGKAISGSGYRQDHDEVSQEDAFEDPFRDPQPGSSDNVGPSSSGAYNDHRLAHEPFNPGFKSAALSYGDEKEVMGGSGASSGAAGLHLQPPPGQRSAADDDDDIYEATPKSKEPAHRY
ncbi:hypothetical protein TOPH_03408 [Tolypocladium ophioglossoides CBS 100239]|uniref:GAT domain-containing protein n=1 Tax=Tolypocladium ophioglossoides (strain CBS 100239) TaxID=1163406 RepID=A0A0L0NDD6_TOLOC|nr:hypothetical protein TOPH_03408 [Tolypocladium ophioglossoides CBS 100239]